MSTFRAYYMRPEWFPSGLCGKKPDASRIGATHILLRTVEADSLEHAYQLSQGEVWSPNGEARDLIRSKGLQHTSMSVGDVLQTENDSMFIVASFGFRPLS